ncbi:MAG: hypothetical protein WD045_13585, partial [Pirellulaceae bacterium]
ICFIQGKPTNDAGPTALTFYWDPLPGIASQAGMKSGRWPYVGWDDVVGWGNVACRDYSSLG